MGHYALKGQDIQCRKRYGYLQSLKRKTYTLASRNQFLDLYMGNDRLFDL